MSIQTAPAPSSVETPNFDEVIAGLAARAVLTGYYEVNQESIEAQLREGTFAEAAGPSTRSA